VRLEERSWTRTATPHSPCAEPWSTQTAPARAARAATATAPS